MATMDLHSDLGDAELASILFVHCPQRPVSSPPARARSESRTGFAFRTALLAIASFLICSFALITASGYLVRERLLESRWSGLHADRHWAQVPISVASDIFARPGHRWSMSTIAFWTKPFRDTDILDAVIRRSSEIKKDAIGEGRFGTANPVRSLTSRDGR